MLSWPEIQNSKFALNFKRQKVSRLRSFFSRLKAPCLYCSMVEADLSSKLHTRTAPIYAPIPVPVWDVGPIGVIERLIADANVYAPVIKTVAICMIDLLTSFGAEDEPVQVDLLLGDGTAAVDVEAARRSFDWLLAPNDAQQTGQINLVHQGVSAIQKRQSGAHRAAAPGWGAAELGRRVKLPARTSTKASRAAGAVSQYARMTASSRELWSRALSALRNARSARTMSAETSEFSGMTIIRATCPHCGMLNVGLEVRSSYAWPVPQTRKLGWDKTGATTLRASVGAYCDECSRPVGFVLRYDVENALHPNFEAATLRLMTEKTGLAPLQFVVEEVHPSDSPYRIPESLPDNAAEDFRQAEQNYRLNNAAAASGMYGAALEKGLKWRFPGVTGMLDKRIKKLVDDKLLPTEIGDWAHQVRIVRNGALHDETPITADDMEAARSFADAVLRYCITLPVAVALRRGRPVESILPGWIEPKEAEG